MIFNLRQSRDQKHDETISAPPPAYGQITIHYPVDYDLPDISFLRDCFLFSRLQRLLTISYSDSCSKVLEIWFSCILGTIFAVFSSLAVVSCAWYLRFVLG